MIPSKITDPNSVLDRTRIESIGYFSTFDQLFKGPDLFIQHQPYNKRILVI